MAFCRGSEFAKTVTLKAKPFIVENNLLGSDGIGIWDSIPLWAEGIKFY